MKDYSLWKKTSNIAAYTGGTCAIIHTFFKEFADKYITVFVVFYILTITLYVVSELAKLRYRKK